MIHTLAKEKSTTEENETQVGKVIETNNWINPDIC